jgi:hypothetical protein
VLGFETNYYRFEVQEGQTVKAEFVREARTDLDGVICNDVDIVDRSDRSYGNSDIGGDTANVAQIKAVEPFEVEEGLEELFLKIETDGCSLDECCVDWE